MSQDMMQTLSGSSLLSLSIGTLPAVKSGMSLDANPFASQLALMSGTEASVAGMLAPAAVLPGAGEGAFAATLADVAVPAQPSTLAVDGAANILPRAAATSIVPVPVAPAAPVVAPLPEEASASQLIEAALTGAATIAPAPAAPAATPAQAKTPAAPSTEPEASSLPLQAGTQTQTQMPVTVQPLPHAAEVPHLRNLIRADAPMPIQAQLPAEAEPVAADSVSPAAPRPRSRAENSDETIQLETPIVQALPLAIAPVQAPRPETPVTDLGTTRIAAEAAPEAPRQPAALHEAAGPVQPAARAPINDPLATAQAPLGQAAAAAIDPAALAPLAPAPLAVTAESVAQVDQPISVETAAPTTLSAEPPHGRKARLAQAPVEPVQPAIVQPMPMAAVADAPVVLAPVVSEAVAAPIDTLASRAARSAPAQHPGIPAPAAAAPQTGQLISPAPDQAAATLPAPAAPLVQAVEQNVTAAAPTSPQGVAQPGSQVQAQAQIQPQPAAPAQVVEAAEAAPMAMTAPAQAQTAAPAARTNATRAPISAPARRMVEGAVQSPRPAEALSALFDLADPGIQPAISSLNAEQGVGQSIEAVPPAWAAALNAVSPQVQQPATVGAPLGAANPAQVPVHNLAFDAGFVAGIESQIARLADGGQMVKIQVMPEHLGRIDIEMLAGPERDQVRIVTEHDAVRDTLVSSQHRLEQDLRANGQRNAEVTVELRQQSPGTQNGSAQQQQQRGQFGAESASARDAAQRANTSDGQADTAPAPRRPRGNVRYA